MLTASNVSLRSIKSPREQGVLAPPAISGEGAGESLFKSGSGWVPLTRGILAAATRHSRRSSDARETAAAQCLVPVGGAFRASPLRQHHLAPP
ncbi:hypothetical protein NDU88_005766 [Pleurodeles waltl]|uniref:Uncharacterized protein n=1 Tax=Pleurodeles waltl TaxID=8319 RepID=A0AAV7MKE9_PLEWA|nr:hypothetical protein NDU88_005766 [Pleurodeles waltl]